MSALTQDELARGRALLKEAFTEPWRYTEFEIECGVCQGGTTSVCNGKEFVECTNPECDGTHAPCTFMEAPAQYPGVAEGCRPMVVATIDVPGLSCLAQKNGEAICWLRNNAEGLIAARETLNKLAAALAWLSMRVDAKWIPLPLAEDALDNVFAYAKSLGWTGGRDVA